MTAPKPMTVEELKAEWRSRGWSALDDARFIAGERELEAYYEANALATDEAADRKADQDHADWVEEMTYAACEVDDGELQ